MKNITKNIDYKGKLYTVTWIPGDSYEKFHPTTQSAGFCFNDNNELLVIRAGDGKWKVPGGTIEKNETPEETLIREMDEEADIEIEKIIFLGAQKVEADWKETDYQLRFAAKITRIKPRTIDPATGRVDERKLINPKDFIKESGWGKLSDAMIKRAIEVLNIVQE